MDSYMLRERYEQREMTEVLWIPTHQNPAEAFPKFSPCKVLEMLIETNKLHITPNAWVERSKPAWA